MRPIKRYRSAKPVSRGTAWILATLEPETVHLTYGIVVRNLAAPPTDYAVTSSILTDTANFFDDDTQSDAKEWRTEVKAVRHASAKCSKLIKSGVSVKDLQIQLSRLETKHVFDTDWRNEPCGEVLEF